MIRLTILMLTPFALIGVAHASEVTSVQLSQDIQLHGAKSVVQTLDRTGRFDTVLSNIASGKTAWVRLAPDLANGTDAGNSTGLTVALAKALPRNPRAVVGVLDSRSVIGAEEVCGVPFIEPTPDEVARYLKKAIPAVAGVPRSARFPHRAACLTALHHVHESAATH